MDDLDSAVKAGIDQRRDEADHDTGGHRGHRDQDGFNYSWRFRLCLSKRSQVAQRRHLHLDRGSLLVPGGTEPVDLQVGALQQADVDLMARLLALLLVGVGSPDDLNQVRLQAGQRPFLTDVV